MPNLHMHCELYVAKQIEVLELNELLYVWDLSKRDE